MPTKTPRERIQEIMFATCPVDVQEPFFWKWNEHGLDMLEAFYVALLEEARQEEREKAQGLEKLIEEIGKKMCHFKFLYPNAGKWLIQDMWGWEYQGETLMEVFQAFKKEREKQEKS